jgi:hypothetical protein
MTISEAIQSRDETLPGPQAWIQWKGTSVTGSHVKLIPLLPDECTYVDFTSGFNKSE